MKQEFIITLDELQVKGLNLCDYVSDECYINAIITKGFDICISRCCFLNDSFNSEDDIEKDLEENPFKVTTFKKLQYNVIYNLIFTAEDSPIDLYIDTIITHELKWGKINGFQKGLHYKNN